MNMDECFACPNHATTREHVPPICLFPELKDTVDGRDHRKSLITVPACEEHNTNKSADDWYFLWVLSTNVMANTVGTYQAMTKLARGHKRRPVLGASIIDNAVDVMVDIPQASGMLEASEAPLDGERFDRILRLVALGVYRHHYGRRWLGQANIQPDFIGTSGPQLRAKNASLRRELFDVAGRLFDGQPRYGHNPDVFWYQTADALESDACVMRFAFYGRCTATGLFTKSG